MELESSRLQSNYPLIEASSPTPSGIHFPPTKNLNMASSTKSRSISFSTEATRTRYPANIKATPTNTSSTRPATKMTLMQTYRVAHQARAKLAREAARADHDLRRLVGHANMLDSLMCELAEAEREQENWFDQTVRGAVTADMVVEEPAEDWHLEDAESDDSDSDSDSDSDVEVDEDEIEVHHVRRPTTSMAPRQQPRSSAIRSAPTPTVPPRPAVTVSVVPLDLDDDEEYEDDEADSGDLALVRTRSHPPPDLLPDSEDDSEDDDDASMPPSPPQPVMHHFTDAERKAISTTSYYDQSSSMDSTTSSPSSSSSPSSAHLTISTDTHPSLFVNEDYFLPRRATPTAVSAC